MKHWPAGSGQSTTGCWLWQSARSCWQIRQGKGLGLHNTGLLTDMWPVLLPQMEGR